VTEVGVIPISLDSVLPAPLADVFSHLGVGILWTQSRFAKNLTRLMHVGGFP